MTCQEHASSSLTGRLIGGRVDLEVSVHLTEQWMQDGDLDSKLHVVRKQEEGGIEMKIDESMQLVRLSVVEWRSEFRLRRAGWAGHGSELWATRVCLWIPG